MKSSEFFDHEYLNHKKKDIENLFQSNSVRGSRLEEMTQDSVLLTGRTSYSKKSLEGHSQSVSRRGKKKRRYKQHYTGYTEICVQNIWSEQKVDDENKLPQINQGRFEMKKKFRYLDQKQLRKNRGHRVNRKIISMQQGPIKMSVGPTSITRKRKVRGKKRPSHYVPPLVVDSVASAENK
eukprot:snap_masked-scaffold_54-processed-gene-1.55-mRNA-1 protein AED:0.91 eAED:0.91 QI:0/0/0/0.5/1/1/2/0/179